MTFSTQHHPAAGVRPRRHRRRRAAAGSGLGEVVADANGVAVDDRQAFLYGLTSRGVVDRRVEVAYGVGPAVFGVQLGGGDAVDEEWAGDLGADGDRGQVSARADP
jgi:hypothetical protein